MGRWGDGEMGRWGDGEMGRWGDGEMGRWGDGEMGRWGDGEMGRWGDGEMGRWGDGERRVILLSVFTGMNCSFAISAHASKSLECPHLLFFSHPSPSLTIT